ncbi:hypothetical protein [Candidatus Nitrotoga sp. AM1P]|uniref:hypothetical protein n=1 Tax=Candidatus Nitrotoga sp. AM1P TaxID=2559597 RepID=UPI0010BC3F46|nr:hypothetical protein [Candidatus Nitrotoga sp. AM1P]BBJ22689.1 hypothetical protein W01_06160 [Candidatus Nitrotoga sp. AM1P]
MTIHNFLKLQVFALLFAAIISPLSAVADIVSNPATIKFVLGTHEVLDYGKDSCSYPKFAGTITGIGSGTITEIGKKSKRLGVLSLIADDCITPNPMQNSFSARGNLMLTTGNGDNIMANYSVSFIPTSIPLIYKYEDFDLHISGGTGLFTGATGSGILEGTSNIKTGLGIVEGTITMYISK